MSAVAVDDTEDLEALFDSIAAAHAASGSGASPPPAQADGVGACAQCAENPALLTKLGQLTRTLHESLRELGYDRMVVQAASSIPDARERLTYVANLTERAAQRVLNATDVAGPIQERLSTEAAALGARWRRVYAGESGVDEFKTLAGATLEFLDQVPVQAKATGAQLMEIVMAQDFQDLTGQVIKRINDLAHDLEQQLLKLLLESTPLDQRPPRSDGLLNGPVVNAERAGDVAHTQAQVDDLLESLGF